VQCCTKKGRGEKLLLPESVVALLPSTNFSLQARGKMTYATPPPFTFFSFSVSSWPSEVRLLFCFVSRWRSCPAQLRHAHKRCLTLGRGATRHQQTTKNAREEEYDFEYRVSDAAYHWRTR
jgi:hypothetical protein